MNLSTKKLFIFDLDGTLIDSVPDISTAVNETLSHYSLPNFSEDIIRTWVGNGSKKLIERALYNSEKEGKNISNIDFEQIMALYFKKYKQHLTEKTYVYSGVVEALKFLKNKNALLAIVTNKPYDFIAPVLNFLNLKQYFNLWVGSDSLPSIKPSAEPLLYVCKELKISPENAIMTGDSKNDILAAQNAKMNSIGLTYGYNYNEPISNYNPDIVLDNLADIREYFK